MRGIFDPHMQLLQRSLDFRSRRNTVLASNIANLETPGYKARDLVFERALGRAMEADQPGPLAVTDPRHLDGRQILPLSQVRPQLIHSANPVGNVDGNTVDLEQEMAKLGENQVAYQALTQMISSKFSQLRLSIREGDF